MNITLGDIHIESWKVGDPLWSDWMIEDDKYADEIRKTPPDQVVLQEGEYKLEISYPLTNPSVSKLKVGKRGLTRKALVAKICAKYKEIYASEDDPGHIPGMYNRAQSEGKYGIWGHDLCDLILCSAHVKGKTITLGVDS